MAEGRKDGSVECEDAKEVDAVVRLYDEGNRGGGCVGGGGGSNDERALAAAENKQDVERRNWDRTGYFEIFVQLE